MDIVEERRKKLDQILETWDQVLQENEQVILDLRTQGTRKEGNNG